MSDAVDPPGALATPEADPSAPEADPSAPEAVDWRASAARGAFEEALARLRALEAVGRGVPQALEEAERLVAFRAAARARDHREAARLAAELEASPPGMLPARTAGLSAAVAELEAADRSPAGPTAASFGAALAQPLARAEAENALGVRAANAGRFDEARERFARALEADPRQYRAVANLGNLELEAGRLGAAVERYREAIRLNADYGTAHNNLAAALRRQGKVAESVAALRRAQRLSLKDPGARPGGSGGSWPRAGRGSGRAAPAWWSNALTRWLLIAAVVFVLWRLLGR